MIRLASLLVLFDKETSTNVSIMFVFTFLSDFVQKKSKGNLIISHQI